MENLLTPLGEDERQKLITAMDHIYDVFVSRVAEGRHLTAERVNEIGRGRVWTGAQAKENGLVDELGGFMTAVQAAKQAAGIEASKEVQLVFYPHAKGLLDRVGDLLGARALTPVPPQLRDVLRATAFPFPDGSMLTLM